MMYLEGFLRRRGSSEGSKNEKSSTRICGGFFAVRTGLEPATPCVTGMYSNQLNYRTSLDSGCKDTHKNETSKQILRRERYFFSPRGGMPTFGA